MRRGADRAVRELGGEQRIHLVDHRRQEHQRRVAPVFRHVRRGERERAAADAGDAGARLVVMLEAGRLARLAGDHLDLRRDRVERKIVGVARQEADGEAEPVGRDRTVEGGATGSGEVAHTVERDMADGDEVGRGQDRS